MSTTKIEWATNVWNPVTGCVKISEGCKHCYAEKFAKRLQNNPNFEIKYKYRNGFKPTFHPESLKEPFTYKKASRVFVCSMGDLFHVDIQFDWINRIFSIMSDNDKNTYMILTKRPKRVLEFFEWKRNGEFGNEEWRANDNIWFGVTVENQETANNRIPLLIRIPCKTRFISCEPLLGNINLFKPAVLPDGETVAGFWLNWIDWVIIGGESGGNKTTRPMHPDWVRSIHEECKAANIPFFFKGWGDWQNGYKIGKKYSGDFIDGKQYHEFPKH